MSDGKHVKKQRISLYSEQYDHDLKFIDKIDRFTSDRVIFLLYFCPLVACLVAHTFYMTLFAMAGVTGMVIFNVFSVLFYAAMIILAKGTNEKLNLVYASLAEIILHAVAATIFVGLLSNFAMFLLMVIPLAFLMPNKNRWAPFIVLLTTVPLYGLLNYFYNTPGSTLYDLSGTSYQKVFYVINIFIGSFVLVYVATIFTITNRYFESKIRMQNEQLKILASTDPLTKLNNRREINRILTEICSQSRDSGSSYIIGIGDIDNFKRVNDTYGHDMGDEVLASVASIIGNNLPETGCASRWGGEEFLFVIPNTCLDDGRKCADNIITLISNRKFTVNDNEFSVTMTIGLCEGTPNENIDKVITCADSRLYKGKHNGKNHTEFTD